MAKERENVEVWVDGVRIKSALQGDGSIYLATTNEDDDGDVLLDPADLAAAAAFVNGRAVSGLPS